MSAEIRLRRATAEDMEQMSALIVSAGMPNMELEEWVDDFWVVDQGGEIVGCAGIETYGEGAVLRSVAIAPALRGTGWGVRLVRRCLDYAKELGSKRCYLFTMTAEEFFPRFGFERCTLDDFEPAVRDAWQYRGNIEHEALRQVLIPMRATL
jgi:amino-acid N-acetyltransferase